MITIVLADDEKLIRAGLKKILLDSIDIPLEIIEAKNGEEAFELCKEKQPEILNKIVKILDEEMPGKYKIEVYGNVDKNEYSGNPIDKNENIINN